MPDLDVHLRGIAAREEQAFAAWLAGAEPAVRRALRSFAARVDVESVVQETLLRIWQVAPRHVPDGRPDSLLRLAHRIARNLALDEARRTRRERPAAGDMGAGEETVDPAPAPDPLLRRVLAACLRKLGGAPARALHARLFAGGQRDEALAEHNGMAVNTFRQNVARARRAIAQCLARSGVALEEHLQ